LREPAVFEADWIGRCRAGDMAAWRALYEQHVPLVHRVARRMGLPESDFHDLCQEVFLRVYRGLGRFRGEAQFSTWLYRIVLHEVARAGRARSVRAVVLTLLGRPTPPPVPDEQLARAEATQQLAHLLDRMKPKHRQVFVLYELEELSPERIADVLGCPVETVRSRLRHARSDFTRLRRQQRLLQGEPGDEEIPHE
jgi:RNA polymerase sigma-70 factor (ECF subfamily)